MYAQRCKTQDSNSSEIWIFYFEKVFTLQKSQVNLTFIVTSRCTGALLFHDFGNYNPVSIVVIARFGNDLFCVFLGISAVTFNGSQTFAYFTNTTQLFDINSLLVQFRTRQNNTVILSSVASTLYFEIIVADGRVKVSYNLSGSVEGVIDTGIKLLITRYNRGRLFKSYGAVYRG